MLALTRPVALAIATLALSAGTALAESGWQSFLSPQEVQDLRRRDPKVIVIDARSPKEYAAGHLPGAINLPGDQWRTPASDRGPAQDLFTTPDGKPDVARYERWLGRHGISRDASVVVYGDHAGKPNGSVPAAVLHWLGQERVAFLDGLGADRWKQAGLPLTTEPTAPLPPTTYVARPAAGVIWRTDDVLAHLGKPGVVFYDTRSQKEFTGEDKRDNARGGHIPGAVLLDYAAFLAKDGKTVLPREQVRSMLEQRGITPDKLVVLYCQTATRTSLPTLVLHDLGYRRVALYDQSWQDYGNRTDTPVEK